MADMPRQRYGFVLLPRFEALALAGAVDALVAANEMLEEDAYEAVVLSGDGRPVPSASGIAVAAAHALADAPRLEGVFVVAEAPLGGAELHAEGTARLLAWLKAKAADGAVLGGIGSGAAWLAQAGLLRGHRATLHWPQVALLAERHADTIVSQNLYEIDRGRLTCAGAHASLDMLIAWLGLRHGERIAQALGAHFGLERLRGRDERQRVPSSARAVGGSAKLAEAVALMEANVGEPLPTEDIARLVGVSRRQLERLFKQHLDTLPSRWYLALRLSRARRLLQQTPQSILQIGLACGFASGPHFSNAYRNHYHHTPRDERARRAAAWRASTGEAGSPSVPGAAAASSSPEAPSSTGASASAVRSPAAVSALPGTVAGPAGRGGAVAPSSSGAAAAPASPGAARAGPAVTQGGAWLGDEPGPEGQTGPAWPAALAAGGAAERPAPETTA